MFRYLTLLVCCVVSIPGFSSALKGELIGSSFRWENAYQISTGDYVSSFWKTVHGLAPTHEWLPGGLSVAPPSNITLLSGTDSVDVEIQVKGLEYNIGSTGALEGRGHPYSICSDSQYSSGVVRVSGQNANEVGCFFTRSLTTLSMVNPYSFVRPVFQMDEINLAKAFEGKAAGLYRGSIPVTNFYDYQVSPNSGVRTRFYDTHMLSFEIDYTPSHLTSVTLVGESTMETQYDLHEDRVSGEARFKGLARGWFNDGLRLSLDQSRLAYELNGPDLSTIPYSVRCLRCEEQMLVDDGQVHNLTTKIADQSVAAIPFEIVIGFEDVDIDTLSSGTYSDVLTLIFEPDL